MLLPKMSEVRRNMVLKRFTEEGMILRTFDYDEAENRYIFHSTQECDPILKRNAQMRNDGDGYSPSREWRRAASVPNLIIEQWMKMGINAFKLEDQPKILEMLDSPEYLWLRTAPGRLSKRPIRHFFRASTPTGTKRVEPRSPLRLKTT